MFRVEYDVHLKYAKGTALFCREEQLPFVPFIGLDVIDDILGEFTIEHVAWFNEPPMLVCQSNVDRNYWTLQKATRTLGKAGWHEVKEARDSYKWTKTQ